LYGGIHCDNSIWAYIVHWLDYSHRLSPSTPSLFHLKLFQDVSLVYFIYEVHQPYSLSLISFVHPAPSHKYLPHTVSILQFCLSLLVSKSMFKRVSQCIPTISILHFGPFNPFLYTPLPLFFYPPFFNSFQYISLYCLPTQMLCFTRLLTLCHSPFLSLLPRVPWSSSTITNMFYQ
jgi:hypothetical protein